MKQNDDQQNTGVFHKIITAGSTYLDIDAYACAVALAELLRLKGEDAIAYSQAVHNYSVVPSLIEEGQFLHTLPVDVEQNARYIIVDVSDPEYLAQSVPLDRVVAVYDHHVGFENYWEARIGNHAHIEFIGAAATMIYREWKEAGLEHQMSDKTAQLLVAAILDNTLNLTSSNTTAEDRDALEDLCKKANIDKAWCASYFTEVQKRVESDLRSALQNDTKKVRDNPVLPPQVSQICVWDAENILKRLPEIRTWFYGPWMLNLIDVQYRRCFFVCDDVQHQKEIERVFEIQFVDGVAETNRAYLRKEIIKETLGKQ